MSLTLEQRPKEATFGWDKNVVHGATAHITRSYPGHDEMPQETIDQPNDGQCVLEFSAGFQGDVTLTVTGGQSSVDGPVTFTVT